MHNQSITTVILAGGQGKRMGGNKGLQLLQGRALINWVLDAVSEGSEQVLINANGEAELYGQFGYRVIADQMPDWPGPLAGLQAALSRAETSFVMTVPCDTPFLPHDVIEKLWVALQKNATEAAVVSVEGKRQPTIALYNRNCLDKLGVYLRSGRRKVNDWLDTLSLSEVVFDDAVDFDNINTPDDLARASQRALMLSAKSQTSSN